MLPGDPFRVGGLDCDIRGAGGGRRGCRRRLTDGLWEGAQVERYSGAVWKTEAAAVDLTIQGSRTGGLTAMLRRTANVLSAVLLMLAVYGITLVVNEVIANLP